MKKVLTLLSLAILMFFTQCESLKSLPTNTSGGLFSLNGSWQLFTSNDNRAMEGTIVTVVPGFSEATIRTLNNNTYCMRERDAMWRNIKGTEGETFTIDLLVTNCNGTLYKPATLTVVNNNEIRLTGHTAMSTELVQTWRRSSMQ
jgi:hypothetical protein